MDSGHREHHPSLGRRFAIIARNIQLIIRRTLRDSDIGAGQFMFLHGVARNEGLSQQELSRLLDVDKATCAKAVMKLEDHGYIRREQDSGDLRLHHLRMTKKGRRAMPPIRETMRMVTRICGSALTESERIELLRLLDLVVESTAAWLHQVREDG